MLLLLCCYLQSKGFFLVDKKEYRNSGQIINEQRKKDGYHVFFITLMISL